MSSCSIKLKGCLFFPTLISELCLRAGVKVKSSDEILPNAIAISTTAIKHFSYHASKFTEDPTDTSLQPQAEKVA